MRTPTLTRVAPLHCSSRTVGKSSPIRGERLPSPQTAATATLQSVAACWAHSWHSALAERRIPNEPANSSHSRARTGMRYPARVSAARQSTRHHRLWTSLEQPNSSSGPATWGTSVLVLGLLQPFKMGSSNRIETHLSCTHAPAIQGFPSHVFSLASPFAPTQVANLSSTAQPRHLLEHAGWATPLPAVKPSDLKHGSNYRRQHCVTCRQTPTGAGRA